MIKRTESMQAPDIKTTLPGPNAKQLIETDERYTSPSYTRGYPLAVKRGQGAVIEDVDGNRFLDFTSGIAVCSTGHCHPRVVEAVTRQAQQLMHMSGTDFYYEPQRDLAMKLAEIAPGPSQKRVFFTNSGAESVEAAIKLSKYHTGRSRIIAFLGAFHGRTMGAVSLTGSKSIQRRGFGPLMPGVTHVGYGNCFRCPYNLKYDSCKIDCVSYIEDHLFKHVVPSDEVAAIVVEPIQGEGGYVVPPPEFHTRLRELCDRHRILMVADEVQAGMGRTGKMFAIDHWDVEPDIMCLAKGIASGMPLGAIVAKNDVMTWPPGAHASTFGGNPVSCAASLETIALLEEELIENTQRQGSLLVELLQELAGKHDSIGDVRGKGLMVAIDLVEDHETLAPNAKLRDEIVDRCFYKGLLLLGCGESSIRFCPPLVIDAEQTKTCVRIIDEVMAELA